MEGETSILSLPDEIIILILKRTSYSDCNSFRRTCKRYNDLLKSSHSLWRVVYRKTVGKVIYNTTATHSEGNWISDLRQYLSLRESLIDLVADMSPKHFSEYNKDCGLDNIKEIFAIALSNNTNYYYTVSILQNFIQEANTKISTFETKKPYTLTEIHYCKMVLRYLFHVLYTIKWAQNHVTNQLTPEIVLNFFIQWIDPLQMHSDEDVRDLIKTMIFDVDRALLETRDSVRLPGVKTNSTCLNGIYSEREVLIAISNYIYKQRRMVHMTACNEDTFNIVKTIKSNSGHGACLGAIFEAIARGFGITSCNLIAFPNHMYLEWRCDNGFRPETMQFSLDTGELRQTGRCPFSANVNPNDMPRNVYSADAFVHYIVSGYLSHMGDYMTWQTNNAAHLMDFITNNHNSEYSNFILYLRGLDFNKLTIPFNIEYIHEEHINCVHDLLALNKSPAPQFFDRIVKQRTSAVRYCVGMICFHKVHDYVCVVRGWDVRGTPEFRPRMETLEHGDQPYYHVTAVDQSDRYIAQENLIVVRNPSRVYHLEEVIGKEFTHFNGFFYVPNTEKQALYPEDLSIGNMYASQRNLIPEKVQQY